MMKKKGRPIRSVSKNVVEPGSDLFEELEKRKNKRKVSESKSFFNAISSAKRAAKRAKKQQSSGDEATDEEDGGSSSAERPTSIVCGVCSLQGERPHMEDMHVNLTDQEIAFSANIDENMSSPLSYFAVYDGHGGVKCAEYLEKHLHTELFKNPSFLQGKFPQAFHDVFEEVDKEIKPEWGGSTAACALITGNVLTVANVGDAEVVVAYEKVGEESLSNIVMSSTLGPDDEGEQRRVAAGGGFVAFGRVNGEVAVSRAFGDRTYKRPAYKTDLISAQPSMIKNIFLSPRDRFILLSCDGLYENNVFDHQGAVDFIVNKRKEKDDPDWLAAQLANEAIKRGSLDNVTVMIVFLKWD